MKQIQKKEVSKTTTTPIEIPKCKKHKVNFFSKYSYKERKLNLFKMHSDSDSDSEDDTFSDDTFNSSDDELSDNETITPSSNLSNKLHTKTKQLNGSQGSKSLCVTPSLSPTFTPEIIENIPIQNISRFDERVGYIKRAIGLKSPTIVYDSLINDFDNRTFNSCISGKRCLLFIVHCGQTIMGCYHHNLIGRISSSNVTECRSQQSFIFCIREGHLLSETVMKRKINRSYNICLYPHESHSFLFSCFNAFSIDMEKRVIISTTMKQSFNFKEFDNPFISDNDSSSYQLKCQRILAIQFVD